MNERSGTSPMGHMAEVEAKAAAGRYLQETITPRFGRELAIRSTFDEGRVWIFGWDSKEFLENKALIHKAVVGAEPIVVYKSTGEVWLASAIPSVEEQISERSRSRGQSANG